MTVPELRQLVVRLLCEVAPEADPTLLDLDEEFREQLDIDSMDLLNFVIALHEHTQVDIPEVDYPRLSSVNACVAYLKQRLG